MRTIVISQLFFLIYLFASCQNQSSTDTTIQQNLKPEICIHVNDLNQDSILIEFNLANINKDSLLFKFPKVIPGTYRYNIASEHIKHFQCFDINNEKLQYNKIDDNTFLIPKSEHLKKITYYVTKGKSNDVYDVLTKIVFVDSFCIINPASFIGYLDNFREIKYNITIKKSNKWNTFLSSTLVAENNNIDKFDYRNYDELIENPLLYCGYDTISLVDNNFNATISVYSDNKNITASKIASWIRPLTSVLNNYTSFIRNNEKPYRFIFIFSDEFKLESALEQKNASAYCLRSNWDTTFLTKTIQHMVAHEYLHTITPLNFQSNIYKNQLYETYNSKHLWLYEGVIEYLSIKANLDSKEISFNKFLQYLAMMYSSINQDDKCDKESLTELSQNVLFQKDFSCFQEFYNKGGLFAFSLDLQISIKSDGKDNLIKAIERYIKKHGEIFNENEFIHHFLISNNIKESNIELIGQRFNQYIDSMLQSIGYLITQNQTQWVETVYNQFFITNYYKNKDMLFINFNENSELKNKTVKLIGIDNTTINESILLKRLIYPPNPQSLEVMYEFDNKKNKKVIKPTTSIGYRVVRKIEKTANPTLTQQNNLNYFIGYLD